MSFTTQKEKNFLPSRCYHKIDLHIIFIFFLTHTHTHKSVASTQPSLPPIHCCEEFSYVFILKTDKASINISLAFVYKFSTSGRLHGAQKKHFFFIFFLYGKGIPVFAPIYFSSSCEKFKICMRRCAWNFPHTKSINMINKVAVEEVQGAWKIVLDFLIIFLLSFNFQLQWTQYNANN